MFFNKSNTPMSADAFDKACEDAEKQLEKQVSFLKDIYLKHQENVPKYFVSLEDVGERLYLECVTDLRGSKAFGPLPEEVARLALAKGDPEHTVDVHVHVISKKYRYNENLEFSTEVAYSANAYEKIGLGMECDILIDRPDPFHRRGANYIPGEIKKTFSAEGIKVPATLDKIYLGYEVHKTTISVPPEQSEEMYQKLKSYYSQSLPHSGG